MALLGDDDLEKSAVVANCHMNRERGLTGSNAYDRELRFNLLDFLRDIAATGARAKWLDLCCGTGRALIDAAEVVDSDQVAVEIVGVDLVKMFRPASFKCLRLIAASLGHWQPNTSFNLITCVHGLHYIGDKLGLISRAATWLTEHGRFVANLDMDNIQLRSTRRSSRIVAAELRRNGFEYSFRNKVLRCDGRRDPALPFRYLGADDQAGPNYTGQPAVDSYYDFGNHCQPI